MKKKILVIASVLTLLLSFTGCAFDKEAMLPNEFEKIAQEHDFKTRDVTKEFKDNPEVKTVIQAEYDALAWAEFYVFEDEKTAIERYEMTVPELDKTFGKEKGAEVVTEDKDTFTKYKVTTDNVCNYICRIDDTLLYVQILDLKYFDKTSALVDALNY